MKKQRWLGIMAGAAGSVVLTLGCGQKGSSEAVSEVEAEAPPPAAGVPPEKVADMLHAVMEADRTVYTKQVVNRLVKEQGVQVVNPETKAAEKFHASEQWKSEHGTLPLPAQMFRMGAEQVAQKNVGFSYALLSKWPVNKQNLPKTPIETAGLTAVVDNKGSKPYYGSEELGGQKYFTAVYADTAIASACIDCHNEHKDSPRRDFELDDVMGGVVIRIPL